MGPDMDEGAALDVRRDLLARRQRHPECSGGSLKPRNAHKTFASLSVCLVSSVLQTQPTIQEYETRPKCSSGFSLANITLLVLVEEDRSGSSVTDEAGYCVQNKGPTRRDRGLAISSVSKTILAVDFA
jgi:hypothetical protein